MMQIATCIREASRQLGAAHPRVLELSRRSTGLADYLPEAEIVRIATHEANVPLPYTWQALPFQEDAVDICVVTDVYEHIAAADRPKLLSEMMRVTRGLVLLGCPIENELVTRLDRLVFDFIWGKYAERYQPLDQHIGFGVDPLDRVLSSLKAAGADRVVALPCNYVFRWIHLILIYFDLQHRNPYPEICEPINRIYNEYLSPFDYREPCYRYLVVCAIDSRLSLDQLNARLQAPSEPSAAAAHTEGLLLQAFRAVDSSACDALRALGSELQRVHENALASISDRDQLLRSLQVELHAKVSERDEIIHALQEELYAKVSERDEIIRQLQFQLTLAT
jgi:hypothetical protein